jgi:hypothetical protein
MTGIHTIDFITNKLAYVRYILNLSKEQASLSEPLGSVSLLLMHDAIEMTLHLSAVHLGLRGSENLMQYWELFSTKVNLELGYKGAIDRLNKARVNLKHHGIFPDKSELAEFVIIAEAFISEIVLKIFDLELHSISLSAMVEYEPVRVHLQNADKCMKEAPEKALEEIAIAFTLFLQYYQSKNSSYGRSVFGRTLRIRSARHSDGRLEEEFKSHKAAIEILDDRVEILMLGIDYIQYSRYLLCAPKITPLANGSLYVQPLRVDVPTVDSAQYAQTFVLEQILRLQRRSFETRLESGRLVIASHLEKDKATLYNTPAYKVDGFFLHQRRQLEEKVDESED